jgi:hypothetical protein
MIAMHLDNNSRQQAECPQTPKGHKHHTQLQRCTGQVSTLHATLKGHAHLKKVHKSVQQSH